MLRIMIIYKKLTNADISRICEWFNANEITLNTQNQIVTLQMLDFWLVTVGTAWGGPITFNYCWRNCQQSVMLLESPIQILMNIR